MVGQMFLVRFTGSTVTNEIRTMIETYYVGNIMLSHRNMEGTFDASFLDVATLGIS